MTNIAYKTPQNDYIFKKIFGTKGNEEILKKFLEAILEEKIEQVTVDLQTEVLAETIKEKGVRLDVRARLDNKTEVNIEIQLNKRGFSEERCLEYWSRIYQTTVEKGKDYMKARRTIGIWILGENVYEDTEKYHTKWQMQEVNSGIKGHFMHEEIHIIELKKLHFHDKMELSKMEAWLWFIKHDKKEAVEMACYTEKQIQEAEEQYKKITSDEKMMAIIEVRERARREILQDNYDAKQEGIEQGIKEGIEQGKKEGMEQGKKEGMEQGKKEGIEHGKAEEKLSIAKKLKQSGMDIKQISEITGLAEEEIEKL